MVKCEVCGNEFPNRRGFHSHMEAHERKGEKETPSLLESLFSRDPSPVSRVELDLSPEGHLKISVKKENLTQEELRVL